MTKTQQTTKLWELLDTVEDPEVPVISIVDLGIVKDIEILEDSSVTVTITPTYSGCPAMEYIEKGIRACLESNGYTLNQIITVLKPAWTTDWLTEKGREKLKAYGIAPPLNTPNKRALFSEPDQVQCPQCQSKNTEMVSQFGSTACKALYKCKDCLEPFDYFKCI